MKTKCADYGFVKKKILIKILFISTEKKYYRIIFKILYQNDNEAY